MSELFRQGYAVVIGVGADLPVTVNDATMVANLLCDPTRCAYPPDQVHLLTGEQARCKHVLDALDWLATNAGAEATVIVYFSGHGIETPEYYLMPYGYDTADLTQTAIPGTTFTKKLRTIQAKKLVVLLDCCHAGGQAEAKGLFKSPLPPSVLDQLGKSSGRVVIASSRKDEQSWTGHPYSVFTTALFEGLSGYGAFELDGYARVLDIALWVGRKVPERTGDRQHPIISISNLEDNFPIAWYAAGIKSPLSLFDRSTDTVFFSSRFGDAQVTAWSSMLRNYRQNLLLIEERMSEYIEFEKIPLQLTKNKRQTQAKITELEQNLGLLS